jgi:hypothetical protein
MLYPIELLARTRLFQLYRSRSRIGNGQMRYKHRRRVDVKTFFAKLLRQILITNPEVMKTRANREELLRVKY